MHRLEPECLQLRLAGVIDEDAASRAVALERGTIFLVFQELRFVLYAAVAAITSGVGILVKMNLDRIGPLTLMTALAIVAAACYASAIRTRLRGESRAIGGDYLLLLGALMLSADLGYAEFQFHWLGVHWSWHLLILAGLHALTAYLLDSRLVLSVSLTSLAGWFGVETNVNSLFQLNGSFPHLGVRALLYSSTILVWREIHRRLGGAAQFEDVFEHFAANVGFWGALALTFALDTRLAGTTLLIVIAAIAVRKGLRSNQEIFIVYGIAYTAFGLCGLEAQVIKDFLLAAVLELATMIAAVTLLWRFHVRIRATPA